MLFLVFHKYITLETTHTFFTCKTNFCGCGIVMCVRTTPPFSLTPALDDVARDDVAVDDVALDDVAADDVARDDMGVGYGMVCDDAIC